MSVESLPLVQEWADSWSSLWPLLSVLHRGSFSDHQKYVGFIKAQMAVSFPRSPVKFLAGLLHVPTSVQNSSQLWCWPLPITGHWDHYCFQTVSHGFPVLHPKSNRPLPSAKLPASQVVPPQQSYSATGHELLGAPPGWKATGFLCTYQDPVILEYMLLYLFAFGQFPKCSNVYFDNCVHFYYCFLGRGFVELLCHSGIPFHPQPPATVFLMAMLSSIFWMSHCLSVCSWWTCRSLPHFPRPAILPLASLLSPLSTPLSELSPTSCRSQQPEPDPLPDPSTLSNQGKHWSRWQKQKSA